jgi:hypothetical protein
VEPEPIRDVASLATSSDHPTPERLVRSADRLTEGEVESPENLDPEDEEWLIGLIYQRLRARPARFIDHQIALEIHGDTGPSHQGKNRLR